jgi:microsomal prostaglandin-E synthase 2
MIYGKLYQYAACPFCRKVRAGLRFKGMDFAPVEVHPLNKRELSFSSYKKVPVFVDAEGNQVNDSSEILKALDRLVPAKPLFSTDELQSQQEQHWMQWADSKLVRALSPVIYETLPLAWKSFGYVTRICGFSSFEKLWIRTVGSLVMWKVAAKKAKEQGIKDPVAHLEHLLQELAKAVQTGFLSKSSLPSCADITIWGYLDCLRELEAWKYVEANPSVRSWMQRVEQQFEK